MSKNQNIFINGEEFNGIEDIKKIKESETMNKVERHSEICEKLHETYRNKNNDYGDSFSKLRANYPNAILIRIGDKYNRLKTLMGGNEQKVPDESIKDTLLDLANYCIMEVVEMGETEDECKHDCENCKDCKGSMEVDDPSPLQKLLKKAKMVAEITTFRRITEMINEKIHCKPVDLFCEVENEAMKIIKKYEKVTNKSTKMTITTDYDKQIMTIKGEYGEIIWGENHQFEWRMVSYS